MDRRLKLLLHITVQAGLLTWRSVENGEDGQSAGQAGEHHQAAVEGTSAQAVQQTEAQHIGDQLHQPREEEVDVHTAP